MKKLKFLVIAFFLTSSITTFSQLSLTSYSINAFGVSTNKNEELSGEIKAFFNRGMYENFLMELSGMYNFKPSKFYRFSIGVGMCGSFASSPVYSVTIPAQLEIFPLQEFKKLSLVFELAPEFTGDIGMRQLWGMRYSF